MLLVTGDHVAHGISPDIGEEQQGDWNAIQANLEATAGLIRKHFPNTIVLTSIGNNDGYHSNAPREDEKD